MATTQWPPAWIAALIEDHYERVAEDPKPRYSLADTIWQAYERGRADAKGERDALADALRTIAIMDIRPHPTGDFEAEALAEAQRISRAALAALEEE